MFICILYDVQKDLNRFRTLIRLNEQQTFLPIVFQIHRENSFKRENNEIPCARQT